MKTGQKGKGRQVQDKSYHLGVLHRKVNELSAEIKKLDAERQQYVTDNSQYAQLERAYEALIKEVRQYEGKLADHNLAMDKSRTGTDPSEIMGYQQQLNSRNRHEEEEVDKIFVRRQDRERATKELEDQIAGVHRAAENKLQSLAPEKLDRYRDLLAQSQNLSQVVADKQKEVSRVEGEIEELDSALRADVYRERCSELERQLTRMSKEKQQLQMDAETAQMDPKEAQRVLLQKVKEDNGKMAELEARLQDAYGANDRFRKQLAELSTDISERRSESGDSHKYEVLYERDQEMTAFMDSFESVKAKDTEAGAGSQRMVTGLLEHISRGLQRETSMPSQSKLAEMKEDLTFKERQLETSQTTKSRLEQELQKRNSELEKINTLDDKITVELKSLNEKIATMLSEMQQLNDIEGLRVGAEATKKKLEDWKENYIRRRDTVKQQVQVLSSKYEKKKSALAENETAKTLDSLEQKLRHYEQSIFHLREYIETKGRETDYKGVKDEVLRTVDELNQMHINAQTTADLSTGVFGNGGNGGGF